MVSRDPAPSLAEYFGTHRLSVTRARICAGLLLAYDRHQQNGMVGDGKWKLEVAAALGVNRIYIAVGLERCEDWWGARFFDMTGMGPTTYSINEHGMLVMDTCLKLVGGYDIQQFRHRGLLQDMQNAARIYLRDAEWVGVEPAPETSQEPHMVDFTLLHLMLQGHERDDVAKGMGIESSAGAHVRAAEALIGARLFAGKGDSLLTSFGERMKPFLAEWSDKWTRLLAIRRGVGGRN